MKNRAVKILICLFIVGACCYFIGRTVEFSFRSSSTHVPVQYWARFEDGTVVSVDTIVVFPIQKPEDIAGMWPEYYVVMSATISGNDFEMYSRPFLFCDDPNLAGEHFDRMVYYVPEPN